MVLPAHPQPGAEVTVDDPKLDLTLAALSDPTRRAVLQLLVHGPRRAGDLALALAMSPPSLSRHLRVLRRSGLIIDDEPEHDARVRLYRVQPQGFEPVLDWLQALESFWSDQLSSFKVHAERSRKTPAASLPESPTKSPSPARRAPRPVATIKARARQR